MRVPSRLIGAWYCLRGRTVVMNARFEDGALVLRGGRAFIAHNTFIGHDTFRAGGSITQSGNT